MHQDDSERSEREARPAARVLRHPSLFRPNRPERTKNDRVLGTNAAGGSLIRRHHAAADVWFLDGEELFNGCIAEIRLAAPAAWLQTRIEGLPEAPTACFHLADGTTIRIALAEGARARWPVGGVDGSLCTEVLEQSGAGGSGRDPEPRQPQSQTAATKPK